MIFNRHQHLYLVLVLGSISLLLFLPMRTQGLAMLSTTQVGNYRRPTCAIIGGGIAGLRCAQVLSKAFDVTVFDTGRLRPGGRCSSRQPDDVPKPDQGGGTSSTAGSYRWLSQCTIDHAAQVLTVPQQHGEERNRFLSFAQQVQQWEKDGILTPFEAGSLFRVRKNTRHPKNNASFRLEDCSSETNNDSSSSNHSYYYGTHGMGSIATEMIRQKLFNVNQDIWVSPSNGVKFQTNTRQWKVQAQGQTLGMFDNLIVAHNGKCADRLMSKTPAKAVHELLKVNFASSVAQHGGKRMTLNSIYSLTFVVRKGIFSTRLPDTFKGAFVENDINLRFLSCQSKKYPLSHAEDDNIEVWTLLSSAAFAKKHKAPQEFLPEDVVKNVTNLMLRSLESAIDLPLESLQPLESRLQLWGAAVPLNTWMSGYDFIYDDTYKVGVCGDWLFHSSIGGAWTSGEHLAHHMLQDNAHTVGLKGHFVRSEETHKGGIGSLTRQEFAIPSPQ
jgi:predicted NAD/FAD-dependent oxidoreductase